MQQVWSGFLGAGNAPHGSRLGVQLRCSQQGRRLAGRSDVGQPGSPDNGNFD